MLNIRKLYLYAVYLITLNCMFTLSGGRLPPVPLKNDVCITPGKLLLMVL